MFAGLSETDDPEVRAALAGMYRRYHKFIAEQVGQHRAEPQGGGGLNEGLAAWAVIGLGTVANIGRELGLLDDRSRRQLLQSVGSALLGDDAA